MSRRSVLVLAGLATAVVAIGVGLWLTTRPGVDGQPVDLHSAPIPNQTVELLGVNTGGPRPQTRHEFARALAKVQEGMPERQVIAILGKPDDIRTQADAGGISTARTREIWRYGTSGHLTFPTLGSVFIDTAGTAQYVFGGRGEPPDPATLSEEQLRPLLRLIDTAPSYNAGYRYNPRPIIQIVNMLQPLGKEKALAALSEYLRVASGFRDNGREGVFLILRVLFDLPTGSGQMPHMYVGAPWPSSPQGGKQTPRFPILLVDDVPLLLVSGYMLAGFPQQPESHLDYFQKHGQLRSKPLAPGNDPLALMDAWVKNAGWLYEDAADRGKDLIANQLLALTDTVYRREPSRFGYRFAHDGDVDAAWNAVVAEVGKLNIRWDRNANRYTFPDGTCLPDPVRKE